MWWNQKEGSAIMKKPLAAALEVKRRSRTTGLKENWYVKVQKGKKTRTRRKIIEARKRRISTIFESGQRGYKGAKRNRGCDTFKRGGKGDLV